MNLALLRVFAVVVPLLFLLTVDFLRHTVLIATLHTPFGFIGTYGLTAAGVAAFSWWVFGRIEQLERQLVDQNTMLHTLNQVSAATAEYTVLQQLMEGALDNVLRTMQVECGVICVLDAENEELASACHRGFSDALAQRLKRAKLADDPVGATVVRTGKPVVMERLFEDPRVSEQAKKEGIQSALSVPLRAQGEVTGVLAIATSKQRSFPSADVEILTNLGSQLGMALRNSALYERAQRSNQELATLLAVGEASTASLELDALLTHALDTVLKLTGVEAAEVWLIAGPEVVMQLHRGADFKAFAERTRFRLGEGFPGAVAQTGQPLSTHRLSEETLFLRQEVKQAGFQTFCAWPLVRQGKVLGVLAVAARAAEALSRPSEQRVLADVAKQLAMAIENAQLYRQVQDAAVVEERERIAREMHDGLAQVLGYMNTQVLTLKKLLTDDSNGRVLEQLTQMQQVVQQLYADVREGILGLRSSPRDTKGLSSAVAEYIARFESMAGFRITLEYPPELEPLQLKHAHEIQLMRVVQEALSNTRKHANARRAAIKIDKAGRDLLVTIADDGVGFDPSQVPARGWPRFGLQTMRERVEAIGGKLAISSAPGQGTRVEVKLPLYQE
ncbi:MAG: GAF domain-containing protein [Chloroflexi bacterium]|nr:GAF domain-containing protein [Chloroflexota bacterium]